MTESQRRLGSKMAAKFRNFWVNFMSSVRTSDILLTGPRRGLVNEVKIPFGSPPPSWIWPQVDLNHLATSADSQCIDILTFSKSDSQRLSYWWFNNKYMYFWPVLGRKWFPNTEFSVLGRPKYTAFWRCIGQSSSFQRTFIFQIYLFFAKSECVEGDRVENRGQISYILTTCKNYWGGGVEVDEVSESTFRARSRTQPLICFFSGRHLSGWMAKMFYSKIQRLRHTSQISLDDIARYVGNSVIGVYTNKCF